MDELFPKAFRKSNEEGYIRTASHSSTPEGVVYLTDKRDIANVYGTITSWTDVQARNMRFHPAGVVLELDTRRLPNPPRWMPMEEHSAKTIVKGVSDHVLTTVGRVGVSAVVRVHFVYYPKIIGNHDLTMVADGFPTGLEGLSQKSLHDVKVVKNRLAAVASKVRQAYPDFDVTLDKSDLTHNEAIKLFEAT